MSSTERHVELMLSLLWLTLSPVLLVLVPLVCRVTSGVSDK
jgi:hypothetical protein